MSYYYGYEGEAADSNSKTLSEEAMVPITELSSTLWMLLLNFLYCPSFPFYLHCSIGRSGVRTNVLIYRRYFNCFDHCTHGDEFEIGL